MSLSVEDDLIRQIALRTRTIVMAGASPNPERPSFRVMRYLQHHGYRVIPVNPGQAGSLIRGEMAYASLEEIPAEAGDIQMLDLFLRPDLVLPMVQAALLTLVPRGLQTVWMQLGVVSDEAAALARGAGLDVVMDRCPQVEWGRLV